MTYDRLKRFAKFLKVKWAVSSGAIRIAEPPDFEDEYVSLDWDIRPDDVREFALIDGHVFTADKPTKAGWYWYRFNDEWGKPITRVVGVNADLCFMLGIDYLHVSQADGEWAGPLEVPSEE